MPAEIAGRWFYLYLILDVYSRQIVGFEVHDRDAPTTPSPVAILLPGLFAEHETRYSSITDAQPAGRYRIRQLLTMLAEFAPHGLRVDQMINRLRNSSFFELNFMMQKWFNDKTLLITGGTGSFGNAVLKRFLNTDIGEIRIFSRDEKKQDDMRKRYNNTKLKFYIGDVRDERSLVGAMRGVDFVFHAAALKQVPSCEFHPMQAVRTNVLGGENVLNSAIASGVKRVVCLSTDKAVYPINAMGISKAMMEKVMVAASRNLEGAETVICGTRYGNVMASRGSVIPLFVQQVKDGKRITITDPTMTRFMMTLEDAVDLVLYAFEHGRNGDIFVQKAPAATVETLTRAILDLMDKPNHPVAIIGSRHGEKLYESLLTKEERACADDLGDYFRVPPDGRDLNYAKFVEHGESRITQALHGEEYNSHNTTRLDVEGMRNLLLKLDFMQKIARGEHAILEG